MVPKHGPHAIAGAKLTENLGTRFDVPRDVPGQAPPAECRMSYKIAREDHEVGIQIVGDLHRGFDGSDGKVRIEVEVAQLRDGEAIKNRRKATQRHFQSNNARPVGLDKNRICSDGHRSQRGNSGRNLEKAAP